LISLRLTIREIAREDRSRNLGMVRFDRSIDRSTDRDSGVAAYLTIGIVDAAACGSYRFDNADRARYSLQSSVIPDTEYLSSLTLFRDIMRQSLDHGEASARFFTLPARSSNFSIRTNSQIRFIGGFVWCTIRRERKYSQVHRILWCTRACTSRGYRIARLER